MGRGVYLAPAFVIEDRELEQLTAATRKVIGRSDLTERPAFGGSG